MRFKYLFFLFTLSLIYSCSSTKDVTYLSNYDSYDKFDNFDYQDYKIKVDDILKIDIFSQDLETVLEFNPIAELKSSTISKESTLLTGYQVSTEGLIFLPKIGKIKVINLSINQIRKYINDYLTQGGFLIDPVIDIKLINASVTILGEVKTPGKYDFIKNNLNILEALGMAGDLTIFAKRDEVRLIREVNGELKITSVDLTKSKLLTDQFQIFPNDIIIVNPNNARAINGGIIGNAGTLLSLLSFLLSTIIVTTNT